MGLLPAPECTLCSQQAVGTFIHMFWECPPVDTFWQQVSVKLSEMFSVTIPKTVSALLLNSLPQWPTPVYSNRILLAGLTAAKRLIASRWKHPEKLTITSWMLAYLDIILLEQSTARVMRLSGSKIELWGSAAETLKHSINMLH